MQWYMFWYNVITSTSIPVWFVPSLALIATVVLPFGVCLRKEGLYWSVAWSDRVGGVCEYISLLISVIYLQGKSEPAWLRTHEVLISTIVIGLASITALGWFYTVRKGDGKNGRWSDEFHNLVVVFLVVCFVLPSFVLTIALAINRGDTTLLATMSALLIVYLATVAKDKFGRFKSSEQSESLILSGGLTKFIRTLVPVIQRLDNMIEKDSLSSFRPWWKNMRKSIVYASADELTIALKEMLKALESINSHTDK